MMKFYSLIAIAFAGVKEVKLSGSSVSEASLKLSSMDIVIYRVDTATPQTILEVTSDTDCTPKAGGYSFEAVPAKGSALVTVQSPGIFFISSKEHCSPATIIKHTVEAPIVNPYLEKNKVLVAVIKAQKALAQELAQHSSSSSFQASVVLAAVLALAAL